MERSEIFDIAHRRHPIAAPVARDRLRDLIGWLTPPSSGRVLDLGCGEGEWLQELLLAHPGVTGVGVDHMLPATAAQRTAQRGLDDRVRWIEADASRWTDGRFDAVLCVGATHAFGGLTGTLNAVRHHLSPGGQVLLGASIWQGLPCAAALAALEMTADAFPDLIGLVATVQDHALEPSFVHVSTTAEWNDYQFSWCGSLVDWAVTEATSAADREQALGVAREHRREYLDGWRDQFGFATLVLQDLAGSR